MTAPCIVVIEDEASIRRFLRISLEAQGYVVHESRSAEAGLTLCTEARPDLIVLDLGLPDMDGLQVITRVRSWTETPILVLSVRSDERQKVLALDAGANDYVTKPFGISELLARIRGLLRRRDPFANEEPVRTLGTLRIDLAERRVWLRGEEVRLTRKEFDLLALFVKQPDRVLTHQYILDHVWGEDRGAETQNLRVLVAALRHKVEDDPAHPALILTEPAVGYRLLGPGS